MSETFKEKVLKKSSWSQKEVLDMYEAHVGNKHKIKVRDVRVGDIFSHRVGPSNHPCIVLKLGVDRATCVALSTTPAIDLFLTNCESRVMPPESFVTNNVIVVPNSLIIENWVAEYGNHKHLKEVKRMLKDHYMQLLRLTKPKG